jgi:P-type conjugative transfer protein TrbJ
MKGRLARIAVAIVLVASTNARAQIPTTDILNAIQNTITANESVAQTIKQIQEYKTQLDQYYLQIKNAVAPAAYVWDQATRTMDQLRDAMFMLDYYKRRYSSLDTYLRTIKDMGQYRGSPCFTGKGCSADQLAQLREAEARLSEAQRLTNESSIRTLDQQQNAMAADARRLQQLQATAQGAQGQMEAIGAANMLAAQQSNQLLQIRAILVAQQAALVTRQQALADREAREDVAGEAFRAGTFVASPRREW